MSKHYAWVGKDGRELISGAAALKVLKARNPGKYATRIITVRWEERYDINVEAKNYDVIRSRRPHNMEWAYSVYSCSMHERRWCDPDKPTHKRVVAELLKLIEV